MKARIASNLTVKVGGTMAAVVVLAVGLTTLLNLLRFQETYEQLIAQRQEVAIQEIGRVITVGAGLGLRVAAQGNLPGLLRQQAAANPDLSAIVVHDCRGRPVVSQGWTAGLGEPWRNYPGRNRWYVFDRTGLTVGLTVRDSLGTCIAGVAAHQPAASYIGVLDKVIGHFLAIGAVAGVLAIFSAMAAAFYFDDRRRSLHRLNEDLAQIAAGTAPPPPLRVSMPTFGNRWERAMVETYLEARPELVSHAEALRKSSDGAEPL